MSQNIRNFLQSSYLKKKKFMENQRMPGDAVYKSKIILYKMVTGG